MQSARLKAVKEQRNCGVKFDDGANSYSVCCENGAAPNWNTLADITCSPAIGLTGYQSEIEYGRGSATVEAGSTWEADGITFTDNAAVFNNRGFLILTAPDGYCHLQNVNDDSFAVGAQPTGVIRLKKWGGPSGWIQ